METPKLAKRALTTHDVPALMRGIAAPIRELRDNQSKRVDGIHAELVARLDSTIARVDKCQQQLSAMAKLIAALERRLPKG